MNKAPRKVIKRLHYPIEVMLVCVRWYSAYPLSLRHIEVMMVERGVFVDHATVHRWSNQDTVDPGRGVSPAQARGGHELADG